MVVEFGQPFFEWARRHRHDAAVDLLNLQLRGAGVFLLNDGLHGITLRGAHDAAVTCGVGHVEGEQGQAICTCSAHTGHQSFQRVGLCQGDVARQHHHQAVIRQHRHRLLNGMACAQLRFLPDKLHRQARSLLGHRRLHLVCAMPRNDHSRSGLQLCSRVEHMA